MNVGGQAVIEGVMMRNKENYAVAVRLPDGEIKVKKEKSSNFPKIFNVFFIRGIVGLGYTLYDGVRALIWSSNQNLGHEEKLSGKEVAGTVIVSFLFAILIFVALPFFSARLIHPEGFLFDIFDGFFRITLFLGYLGVISLMKDVKILFQYHGAEHKTINCYENKEKLTISNVKKFSRFHPRCGTSFIFVVLLLSIFIFTLIPGQWWIKFIGRILAFPLIAGISYELIKLSDKFKKNILVRTLVAPGLWLQRITTKEPTDEQLEVGIKSLNSVLE
ncbi:MAG: DUF1385 domain-containing protein [Nanoarchaeota archaeon]|nr:DUF1385 domain-containing protein [Nanoarchaeota archaeon]MBU1632218.1 DUF1385 domain-containing protein [Nanoarchaeota archaeon]MBU1875520.1 DUF1385 domain-containing protein [Nanoarchaeota archaeon]